MRNLGGDTAFPAAQPGSVVEGGEAAHFVRAGSGAPHLEIVVGIAGETVQHRIAGQAEDTT